MGDTNSASWLFIPASLISSSPQQVVVAAPFLVTHPVAYLAGAFDLGRQFFIEWSVNFHWLPEPIFTSKWPGRVLLGLTVLANGAFAARKWQA